MTKKLAGLFAAAFMLASIGSGQAPDAHPRGRVAPPNLPHLKALALQRNADLPALPTATEPDWDSRTLGIIGPVKNQGQCGSCWDFSGVFVVETAFNKAKIGTPDGNVFSEQYVLSCCRNGGCNGDDNTSVLKDAKSNGLPLTSEYGDYHARAGQCSFKQGMKLLKITDWGFAGGDAGYEKVTPTQDIKNAIKAYGCVGCAVAASSSWDGYSGGVHHGNSRQIDHDVALVGWHDDAATHEGGYWIMRNSWGPKWGIDGYMQIAYGADMIGTEAVWASVVNPNPPPAPPGPPGPKPPLSTSRYVIFPAVIIGGVLLVWLGRRSVKWVPLR